MPSTPVAISAQERIDYTIEGGVDRGLGVHEVETVLHVDLVAGTASFETHQPESDEGGEVLGSFGAPLEPALRARVRDAFARQNLAGGSASGGPGVSLHRIRVTRGDVVQEVRFTNRDRDVLRALDPALTSLNEVSDFLLAHPVEAISLVVVQRKKASGLVFEITVTNVGTQAIAVPGLVALEDPHDPAVADRWLGVRIALYPPERPGFTAPPLEWSHVGLAAVAGQTDGALVLAPRGVITCETVPWAPPRTGGRHLVQAVFVSYGDRPDTPGEPPMIRGRALSAAIEVP